MFRERRVPIEGADTQNQIIRHSIADNHTCIAIRIDYDAVALYGFDDSTMVKRATLPRKHGYQFIGDSFVVSPDGQYIATYNKSYPDYWDIIKLWDTYTGQLVQEYVSRAEFPINRSNPPIINLSFRADGKQLVALTKFGEVSIWSTINGNLLRFVGGNSVNTHAMALSHDGHWFVALDDNVNGIQSHPRKPIMFVGRYLQQNRKLYGYKTSLRYFLERSAYKYDWRYEHSPRPHYLPSNTTQVGEVEMVVFKIWDAYSGAPIRDLALPKPENEIAPYTYHSWMRNFLLSHDDILLAGVADQMIYIWNTATGEIVQTITPDTKYHLLDFSQDNRYLICHDISQIHIWDIVQQTWIASYNINGQLRSITISKQNRLSATVWNGEHWEIAVIDLAL